MAMTLHKGKNWHDSYFRKVMQYTVVAQQFLQWLAPKEIVKLINFERINLLNTSYIDKHLNETFSDVVFDCQFNNKTKGRIIILIEHQSNPERLLPVRLK